MTVDLTPLANVLLALAAAALATAIPFVVPLLRQRLHVAITADQQAALERALQAGAGAAYKFASGLAAQGGLSNVDVHNSALAIGAQYVASKMPDTLAALGVSQETVQQAVSARLGALLAADPTVTAGTPASSAPAAAPVAAAPIEPPAPAAA